MNIKFEKYEKPESWINGKPFVLKAEFWSKFWLENKIRLLKGWADSLNDAFANVYPYCVLSISWHKCYHTKKERHFYFCAAGHCKNSQCTDFKFIVENKILSPPNDTIVKVYQRKNVEHDITECHRRFVRKPKRLLLAEELRSTSSTILKWRKFSETPNEI